jgi:hypothetical protein
VREWSVHIVLYREGDFFIAHCLEFDLAAQGTDAREAFGNLLDAIDLQARYSLEIGDLGNLFNPAPAEYWRLFAQAEPYTPRPDGWRLPDIISAVECGLVAG